MKNRYGGSGVTLSSGGFRNYWTTPGLNYDLDAATVQADADAAERARLDRSAPGTRPSGPKQFLRKRPTNE